MPQVEKKRKTPITVVIGSDTNEQRVVLAEAFSSSIEARRYHRAIKKQYSSGTIFLVLRSSVVDEGEEKMEPGTPLWAVVLSEAGTPKKLSVYLQEVHAAEYEIPLRHKNVKKFTGKSHVAAWPCVLDQAVLPPGDEEEV